MGCLYKLTSPSGKIYLGITTKTLDQRWKQHIKESRRSKNYTLHNAIRKYGAEAFIVKCLVIADDVAFLLDLEKKAIAAFGTKSPGGYNLVAGGLGTLSPSPITKARMRKAGIARFTKDAERTRASNCTKRLWTDEDFRKTMTIKRQIIGQTESFKNKARDHMKLQRLDPAFVAASKAACSRTMKALWKNPEYVEKIKKARANQSAESKEKRRIGILRAWATKPKETRIGTMRGKKVSEETKAKMRAMAKLLMSDPNRRRVLADGRAKRLAMLAKVRAEHTLPA